MGVRGISEERTNTQGKSSRNGGKRWEKMGNRGRKKNKAKSIPYIVDLFRKRKRRIWTERE